MLKRINLLTVSTLLTFVFALDLYAQRVAPPTGRTSSSSERTFRIPPPAPQTPVPFFGGDEPIPPSFSFVSPDVDFDRALVKGSPFTADSVIETVQTLGDGNRLVRRSRSLLYRDMEGRTRRDHSSEANPNQNINDDPLRVSVITDPVAGVRYMIEYNTRKARRLPLPPDFFKPNALSQANRPTSFGVLIPATVARRRMGGAQGAEQQPQYETRTEKLESKMIEGVSAEGTRITVVIPPGEFGNEREMGITFERWYAAELGMIVLLRHNDPRFGETIFRLTNIMRNDPPPATFQLPADFAITNAAPPGAFRQMRRPLN